MEMLGELFCKNQMSKPEHVPEQQIWKQSLKWAPVGCVFIRLCVLCLLNWNSLATIFLAGTVTEAGNCRTMVESKCWFCDWDCMFLSYDNLTDKKQLNLTGA